jgi:hypothetical protein
MDCIISYIEKHPRDTMRFKVLVINLLEYFASQSTNTIDDDLVRLVKENLFKEMDWFFILFFEMKIAD